MLSLPIPTDPAEIRRSIMQDALLKKPVFEGYKDMCKIIPGFDYPEYDYWYYRFLAGNPDLNYNRSADPKPLKLGELPFDVLSKIFEKLDSKNRFKIQKLSKSITSVVDQLKTAYEQIDLTCDRNSVSVRIEDEKSSWELQYSRTPNGCEVERNYHSEEIVGGDFMKIALQDLGMILRPTKIRVKRFEICAGDSEPIVQLLVSISKTANSQFYVESAEIDIRETNLTLSVLSVMKPGVLENLEIGSYAEDHELSDMSQIKDMEQFKQAKTVNFMSFGTIQSTDLALFSGFEEFSVRVESMELEDVIRLRDGLAKPDNTIFKTCSITLQTRLQNIGGIGRVLGKDFPLIQIRGVEQSCSIANSEKVLKFYIQQYGIVIAKTDPTPVHIYSYSDDSDAD